MDLLLDEALQTGNEVDIESKVVTTKRFADVINFRLVQEADIDTPFILQKTQLCSSSRTTFNLLIRWSVSVVYENSQESDSVQHVRLFDTIPT